MKVLRVIIEYALIILAVFAIRTFVITRVRVDGSSMENTLHHNDIMLLNIISYKLKDPERFDIIVFKYEKQSLIKRVIGLPGDRVAYIKGKVLLNGEAINETYVDKENNQEWIDYKEITIPEGKYYVLGDNRDNSSDSRIIGLIDRKDITGSASLTIYPFKRFGFIKE